MHKSQGQTYEKCTLVVGEKELALGLTYVGLSRVKTIQGLLLRGNYSLRRFTKINDNPKHKERVAAEAWLDTLPQG